MERRGENILTNVSKEQNIFREGSRFKIICTRKRFRAMEASFRDNKYSQNSSNED